MKNKILNNIIDEFKMNENVESVVMSGSITSQSSDSLSDIDLYVYSYNPIDVEFRENLIKKFSNNYELNNQFWESGDEFITKEGFAFDIMYRHIDFVKNNINDIWVNNYGWVGFTTCILYNIKNSKILYDKNNEFLNLQKRLDCPYPEKLVKAVVSKNYPILRNNISSYKVQLEKAINRNDAVNISNRISAFLASYFDILFAVNKQLHPGEKRLVLLAGKMCKSLPDNMEKNIKELLTAKNEELILKLDILLDNLDCFLTKAGLL
jgi:predicted nucleotidyltransferase